MLDTNGFVYLLRFERPISPNHTAQHYIGWTKDLANRIEAHRKGAGARLTQVAKERGIGFKVARVWRGTPADEKRLKGLKNAPKLYAGRSVSFVEEVAADEVSAILT